MTHQEFATVFIPVIRYYKAKEVDDLAIQIYYESLCDIDFNIFKFAMSRIIKTLKFFPKVSEILEIIHGNENDMKVKAWSFVIENLHKASKMTGTEDAPPGAHETIQTMGGWFAAGLWHVSTLDFKKKEFFEYFQTAESMPLIDFMSSKISLELKKEVDKIGNI